MNYDTRNKNKRCFFEFDEWFDENEEAVNYFFSKPHLLPCVVIKTTAAVRLTWMRLTTKFKG